MECRKCGNSIPDDSVFCPFCGDNIARQREEEERKKQEELKKREQEQKAVSKPDKKTKMWFIALAAFCVVLAGLLIRENLEIKKGNETIKELSEAYNQQGEEIADYKETIAKKEELLKSADENTVYYRDKYQDLETRYDAALKKNQENLIKAGNAGKYESIVSYAQTQSIGFSSNKFYTKSPVVVMKKGEKKTVTVVDKLGTAHTIYFRQSGSADVNWVDENWSTEAHLTIKATSVGMTTITITNNYNSEKFGILVFVTD